MVDGGAILQLVEQMARLAGAGKACKAGATVPTPQVGIATPNAMTLRVSASPSMPRRPSARANAA